MVCIAREILSQFSSVSGCSARGRRGSSAYRRSFGDVHYKSLSYVFIVTVIIRTEILSGTAGAMAECGGLEQYRRVEHQGLPQTSRELGYIT
jgi:hypothetical protein